MSDKKQTQAMPHDSREGSPDGANEPPKMSNGEPAGSDAGGGGPYPRPHASKQKKPNFRDGQTNAAYHGPGQLGEEVVDDACEKLNRCRRHYNEERPHGAIGISPDHAGKPDRGHQPSGPGQGGKF